MIPEMLGVDLHLRRQDRVDRGLMPGLSSAEKSELTAARKRISELEAELATHRRASELLGQVVPPKGRFDAIAVMAAREHAVQVATRLPGASSPRFYQDAAGAHVRDRRIRLGATSR